MSKKSLKVSKYDSYLQPYFVLRGQKEKGCKKILSLELSLFSNSGSTASFYWLCLSKCIQEDNHVEIID